MYRDPWITVVQDQVLRPDGSPGTYATVKLKSGVCVIGWDRSDCVHLTSEFHYAVGRTTIEGVSGGIEPDESPLLAAQRELAEEIGLEAENWQMLGVIDPFTAAINSTVTLFVARDLRSVPASPEATELIEHVMMPLDEAIRKVRSGEITHAPTCMILLELALRRYEVTF